MIIDVHVHPFCKEATITPNLEEGIQRQMGAARDPERIELAAAMLRELFTRRSIHDIVREMDAAGVDKACIVGMDLTTHYGVQMVTDEDLPALTALYPDGFIPFVSVDPSLGPEAVDRLVHAAEMTRKQIRQISRSMKGTTLSVASEIPPFPVAAPPMVYLSGAD